MLFTPRLFEFKTATMDFSDVGSPEKVSAIYADLAYCAALNMWTLNDNCIDDFQLTRADFHEWSVQDSSAFGKIMRIALEALTNRSIEELLKEKEVKDNKEEKKKTSLSIIQRLKNFWSGAVE